MEVKKLVKESKAYYCLDCGKCSTLCPIAFLGEEYLPRNLVQKVVREEIEEIIEEDTIWGCLTCKRCEEGCESGVKYTMFIQRIREIAYQKKKPNYPHNEMLQYVMRLMTEEINQNREKLLPSEINLNPSSDYVYFMGCLPYFDVLFKEELGIELVEIAGKTIKLLNHIGVEPQILNNERCCGHDLLWSGEVESFLKLAELNLKEIEESGAKVVIFSCPECYYMFKQEYPKYFKMKKGIKFFHIIEMVHEKLGEMKFKNGNKKLISYHDSCRLGRFVGLYNEPREIMKKMGIEVVEFEKNKNYNICCGSANWVSCGKIGKEIQKKKIEEMKRKGVNSLGVSCPKCKIHFSCYINEEKEKIKVEDLVEIISERIEI